MKDNGAIILLYHRIAAIDTDPWGVCVSPDNFYLHINYLKQQYKVVSLNTLVDALRAGSDITNSICITFDDGYADNYLTAKPILEQFNCPAHFFIPTAFIGSSEPLWWDELEYIFLQAETLPDQLHLQIEESAYDFAIGPMRSSEYEQHQTWKWYNDPPTVRCEAFLTVWGKLRSLPLEKITHYLMMIRTWAGIKVANDFRRPLVASEIESMFNNKLFTAGLHTHTHPDLAQLDQASQYSDIKLGKQTLLKEFNIDSNLLAFPYGSYNSQSIEVCKSLEIAASFTTIAMPVNSKSSIHELGRLQVGDWDLDQFKPNLPV